MSTEKNKAVIRRWIEARNAHDLEAAQAVFADELQERLATGFSAFSQSFPDLHLTVDELTAEGDTVTSRWTFTGTHRDTWAGIPATGNIVSWKGVDTYTVVDGRIAAVKRRAPSLKALVRGEDGD